MNVLYCNIFRENNCKCRPFCKMEINGDIFLEFLNYLWYYEEEINIETELNFFKKVIIENRIIEKWLIHITHIHTHTHTKHTLDSI